MSILKKLISVMVVLLVLGAAVPALWPSIAGSGASIAAMTETDAGTSMIQTAWPIAILVVGVVIFVGIVYYAIRQFNARRNR